MLQVLAYAGVPDALTSKLRANDWVNAVLGELGGKGGGKPTAAQVRPQPPWSFRSRHLPVLLSRHCLVCLTSLPVHLSGSGFHAREANVVPPCGFPAYH